MEIQSGENNLEPMSKFLCRNRYANFSKVASSQRRNLIFTAHGRQIYVWIPAGPFQLLGSIPEMIINPVMDNPNASGYIDPTAPHTINQILVDDLGRDEVLVLATDSGNVCAYHVEAIHSAICRCTSSNYKRPFEGSEVNPFFVEGVSLSAWGLSVHKFSRLIAVSSNTTHITVFAFALTDGISEDNSEDDSQQGVGESELNKYDNTWVHINTSKQFAELKRKMPYNHRSQNLRITYRGHFDNVPCVSFANFDLDANGAWMVSTDISNRVLVWEVWEDIFPRRVFYPGHPMNNPPQRGWTVMPLDPRKFRRQQSIQDACGCEPLSLIIGGRDIVDISRAVEEVRDASQIFMFGSAEYNEFEIDFLPNDIFSPHACIDRDQKAPFEIELGSKSFQSTANEKGAGSPDLQPQSPDSQTDTDSEEDKSESPSVILRKRSLPSLFDEDNEHSRAQSCHHPEFEEVNSETEHSRIDSQLVRNPHRKSPKYLYLVVLTKMLVCDLAKTPSLFPILHFSEHHITLAPYPLDSEYHLICRNVLFQKFSYSVEIHSACDRFNMVKYAPELGLVVAASQKGRVAIICLTWHQDIGFAFRVDWIVPFASQERHDKRPMLPLLGIAVSPMPGFEIPLDVAFIPTEPKDVSFDYRDLAANNDRQSSPSNPRDANQPQKETKSKSEQRHHKNSSSDGSSAPDTESEWESENSSAKAEDTSVPKQESRKQTLAERHAQASSAQRPRESWHGLHPSRHYRLMLYYCDNTVMSYEFWHDWKN